MTIINQFFNFLSNNFEAFLYMNLVWVISMTMIMIMVKVREVQWLKSIRRLIESLFFITVVIGQSVILVLCLYVYWMNYEKRFATEIEDVLVYSTDWVKEDIRIYYIAANDLVAVDADGRNKKFVYEGTSRIKEYQFSPNGKYVLITTENDLVLLNRTNFVSRTIDKLDLPEDEDVNGVISDAVFSPDSGKFVYKKSRWSKITSLNSVYVYDIVKDEKKEIKSPALKLSELVWDESSQNLYFFKAQSLDTQKHAYPFEIIVYKIPLSNLNPEVSNRIASATAEPQDGSLRVRKIDLSQLYKKLTFTRDDPKKLVWKSPAGKEIGIDENNRLYYIPHRWWKKRLFQVPRDTLQGDIVYYQHSGGELAIHQLRWLPSGQYAIMSHSRFGILILEPKSGKIGQLVTTFGYGFGWYPQLN